MILMGAITVEFCSRLLINMMQQAILVTIHGTKTISNPHIQRQGFNRVFTNTLNQKPNLNGIENFCA